MGSDHGDAIRLTSAPNPATVRPLSVLRQSLEHLKRKWLDGAGYDYAREQLKSIRYTLLYSPPGSSLLTTLFTADKI